MRKVYFWLFGVFLISLSFVSAFDFTVEMDPKVIVRDYDNTLEFTAKITDAPAGTYNMYTLADISLFPRESFDITSGSLEKKFNITPTESLDVEGLYIFTVSLNRRGYETVDKKLTVKLVNLEDAVEIASEPIDPESDFLEFYVQNKEDVLLKDLSAKFSSILFETEQTFTLKPFEKKVFRIEVDKDKIKKIKAGIYVMEADFKTKDGSKKITGNLYLGEKKGVSTIEDSSGIFIRSNSVTKVNTGNVVEMVEIKIRKNVISRLFTSFNVEPRIIDRKGLFVEYTWIEEKLGPAEVYNIKSKTNYIFPFVIVLFGALVIVGTKRFVKTQVEVKKSVSHVKTSGGEFALRVKISVKAKKGVENVSVIDKVPSIVKIYKNFGTIKPSKIDPETRRIHWNLGDLEPGEERILSYIVYSRVGFVGKFSLPETIVVFEKERKIHEVTSNQVFFLSDQIRGEE